MPRQYKRDCDYCGSAYHGEGKKYCSQKCSQDAQKKPGTTLPEVPDEHVHVITDGDAGVVYVESSRLIKSPEELFERANLGDGWEIAGNPTPKVRTWSVPMKLDDRPAIVQMYYVAIHVQKKLAETFAFRPIVVNISTKVAKARKLNGTAPASIHYGDKHIPFDCPHAADIFLQVCDIVQPEEVYDHGDTIDAQELGRYSRDPFNVVTLETEIERAAEWFGVVTAATPKAVKRVWLEGNHEERKRRVIWAEAERRQLGSLLTLPGVRESLEWGALFGLDSLGWETVEYPKHCLLYDRLIVTHGNFVRPKSGQSALAEFNRFGKSGISGHTHRIGSYYHRDYNGVKAWFEMGMLGRIRDDYTVFPDWQQGFGAVSWSADRDKWGYEQVAINDGVAYFRGLRLESAASD